MLELATDEGFTEVLDQRLVTAGSGGIAARMARLAGEGMPESYCLRVRTLDLAGNEGTPSETVCTPLRCRVEADDFDVSQGPGAFDEPAWTAADDYAGGPCGSVPKSGCECATQRNVQPAWLLAIVPLIRRRSLR